MRGKTTTAAVLAACVLFALGIERAEATVCGLPPEYVVLLPALASQTLSLGTGAIGMVATKARPGWRNAAIVHATVNLVQAAALLVFDAAVDSAPCTGDAFGRLNAFNLAVEGTAIAGATALLFGAIIWGDRNGPPPATAFVAPLEGGWRAGLALSF